MCGLVGLAGDLPKNADYAFKVMLYLDTLRGEDSTGAAIIGKEEDKDIDIKVFKALGAADQLFSKYAKDQSNTVLSYFPTPKVMIGHNRFATQGGIKESTAHPFYIGSVVGAHNGTVKRHSINKFHNAIQYDVDSQIIYSHLGNGHTIDEVWENADGAMALTWFDKDSNKLYLVRNKERPLSFAYSQCEKLILWASEPWMLMVGAMKSGIKIKDVVDVKVDTLYTFDVLGLQVTHEERPLTPFVPKVSSEYYGGRFRSNFLEWEKWEEEKEKKKSQSLKFRITELVEPIGNTMGYAVGEVVGEDKKSIRANILYHNYPSTAKDIQSKKATYKNNHYYQTNKHWKTVSNNGFDYHVNFFDCMLVIERNKEKDYTTICGDEFTRSEWHKEVKCGCMSCAQVPKWEDRESLKWGCSDLTKTREYYFACKDCYEGVLWVRQVFDEDNIFTFGATSGNY